MTRQLYLFDNPALDKLVSARSALIRKILATTKNLTWLDRQLLETVADRRDLTGDQESILSRVYFEKHHKELPKKYLQSTIKSPSKAVEGR